MSKQKPFPSGHDSKTMKVPPKETASLRHVGALFYQNGWSYGTSSNYSIRLKRDPFRLIITASGKDKSALTPADFVILDEAGASVENDQIKPSAEAQLHIALAKHPEIGSVLHTHSVWSTILSDAEGDMGELTLAGYEMLKGLAGVTTHATSVRLEIFENTQDIPALAKEIAARILDTKRPLRFGFLLRGHGLYTWGRDLAEARRHVEVLEFLLEVEGRRRPLGG